MTQPQSSVFKTQVLPVGRDNFGQFSPAQSRIEQWQPSDSNPRAIEVLQRAGEYLRTQNSPVAFPTETVYGLGADATRSAAVKGIYSAKGRPSDNPLIIHVCDLAMLRSLFQTSAKAEVIPPIYDPLIEKFWPGPLTILLPNPKNSKLAPEVTAGLKTVGVRMPNSSLALSLIKAAGVPIAAPSANASTKPSPTKAEHVLHDLNGRIEYIIDGGDCEVGLESTVVDGLCDPPLVLRPGGLSIEDIRSCPGWENVRQGYKDQSEEGSHAPRAPGMKYKHYSPKAKVVLYEDGLALGADDFAGIEFASPPNGVHPVQNGSKEILPMVGIVRTATWKEWGGLEAFGHKIIQTTEKELREETEETLIYREGRIDGLCHIIEISLGLDPKSVARGLFATLRYLDKRGASVIFVEGIPEGDIAAAVMNRLRKAATEIKK